MPAGGPGDHPLSDILIFNLDTYNKKCDSLIKQISQYVSTDVLSRLFDWENQFSLTEDYLIEFEERLLEKLQELKVKSKRDN